MSQKKLFRIVSLALLFLLVACGGDGEISVSTANISDARLTKDEEGTRSTTTFAPADTFYLLVDLANAPDDTTVKAEWTAVSAEGADPNTVLDNVELTNGSGTLTFDLQNDNPWPAGDYKVDIYLNGELDQTLTFKVSGGISAEPPTAVPAETPEETAVAGLVSRVEDVKTAVIQIEAQGTFVDPEIGTIYNAGGRGSGFIIDPSGIAVTNNHVVTGAALLKVWVGGESEPRNARVLGASECGDLAVIDIEGDGFPYLQWYGGSVDVGLDVYAAGFPLGDPEYTLTRGIVSKANANGESSWASVDGVIEHDATINPGNSGGPLVTADGQIVAVNYAGQSETNQYFAIAQAQALPVIEQLRQGNDYLSIGVNGEAVNNGEGLSGIWVSSVKSGSPADEAGVKGGDIITRIENLVLAVDGTMADYCDILRSHNPGDKLAIEVLRFNTQEVLEGQLNGRVMEQTFSFAQALDEEANNTNSNASGSAGGPYTSYVTVTDDSGLLTLDVPAEWSEVDGSAWESDGQVIGLSVTAAPNLNDFYNTWGTPGVTFNATDQLDFTVDELLDAFDFSGDCTQNERTEYSDAVYAGKYDVWTNCGGTGTLLVVLVAEPADQSYLALITVQVVTDADLDALDTIFNTFILNQQ
ncbi:MAG: serine protease [Ardenticatenaceae bacterium]|nr:serine protease [Anaerolineales bacterium]MCB8938731.1 serine protease [Ardenticatenaceae bacterium]MCB8973967.1 serine protease [Ardenticatenaceae bacterium]